MGKVYIVHESGSKNFLPAREFGELEVMITGRMNNLTMEEYQTELIKHLQDFTERDYLLPVGDPILMCLAAAIVAEVTEGNFSILYWDRVKYTYKAMHIDLPHVGN